MRSLFAVAAFAVGLAFPACTGAQQLDTRPGIAVLPFTNGGSLGPEKEDLNLLEVGIQQMVLSRLGSNGDLRMVERSALKQILEEHNLVTAGHVDAQTAARIGKLVGARYVVTGAFIDLFGDFRLDGRIVNVETGEIVKSVEVRSKLTKLYDTIDEVASKLMAGVNLPPLSGSKGAGEIPSEAVKRYSRGLIYQDQGQKDKAIELFRQLAQEFPQYTDVREALRQLEG